LQALTTRSAARHLDTGNWFVRIAGADIFDPENLKFAFRTGQSRRCGHQDGAMKIQPTETQLTGKWLSRDGRGVADETCVRIKGLVRSHLRQLGRDASGWDVLYRDPDDGRLWELSYPQSELHGGGPPQLRCLMLDEARKNTVAL
jgi:hypothetical protein